ncbi:hypothetical protein [Helicobacter suis]|nr:hypothetical protein [Helicobacter suis]
MIILFTTEQYHPLQTGLASADYGFIKNKNSFKVFKQVLLYLPKYP